MVLHEVLRIEVSRAGEGVGVIRMLQLNEEEGFTVIDNNSPLPDYALCGALLMGAMECARDTNVAQQIGSLIDQCADELKGGPKRTEETELPF